MLRLNTKSMISFKVDEITINVSMKCQWESMACRSASQTLKSSPFFNFLKQSLFSFNYYHYFTSGNKTHLEHSLNFNQTLFTLGRTESML